MNLIDQDITHKLKHNNEKVLRLLFDKYYIPLCVYSLKFIDSYTDAEDLVQNLFVRFWEEKKSMN